MWLAPNPESKIFTGKMPGRIIRNLKEGNFGSNILLVRANSRILFYVKDKGEFAM